MVRGEHFDLGLLAGDIGIDPPWVEPDRTELRQGHDASVRHVLARVGRSVAGPIAFVPGNHDMPVPVDDHGGVNVDGRVEEVSGLRVVGLGGAGPGRFGFPYEWTERQAGRRLDTLFAEGTPTSDIFVSHTPPARSSLDRIAKGRHVGSKAVRRAIENHRPRLFVCGHIHEAWGLEKIGGVPCLNAGALGKPYGQTIAWIVHWSDGPSAIECLRREGEAPAVRERLL